MLRVGSWLYGKKPNASTQSLDSLTELKDYPPKTPGASAQSVRQMDGACMREYCEGKCADQRRSG
ncbi:outer membrane protein iml2 [Penicillium argentinense]|uniref:Outer membrane protein iml2 n=1 Tax=Penicillium argentinense TaxID=1131581 RepID=A0A9W9FF27_9EURO|nr:outer membrane protein iml2 [Penicillium argentinense]KAJ5098905.1 outer membrane protein iml2 [Penicillium argentinense]